MSGFSVFYVTFPDEATAERICRVLLQERLVACVNRMAPVRSMYWWKGQIEESAEVVAFLKAESSGFGVLEKRFLELHPYETACLVEMPLGQVTAKYGKWLLDSLSPRPQEP